MQFRLHRTCVSRRGPETGRTGKLTYNAGALETSAATGGPDGYAAFLAAVTDPSHPGHEAAPDWYGEDYDPDGIEREIIGIQPSRIARSRRGGLKAKGKPRQPPQAGPSRLP